MTSAMRYCCCVFLNVFFGTLHITRSVPFSLIMFKRKKTSSYSGYIQNRATHTKTILMDKEIYGPENFLHKFDFGVNCPIIMMEFTVLVGVDLPFIYLPI